MGVWFFFIVRDFGFLYYVLLADSRDRTADSSHTPPQPTPSLVSLAQSSLARGWLATRREPARAEPDIRKKNLNRGSEIVVRA
jgi:hypothetical protein